MKKVYILYPNSKSYCIDNTEIAHQHPFLMLTLQRIPFISLHELLLLIYRFAGIFQILQLLLLLRKKLMLSLNLSFP